MIPSYNDQFAGEQVAFISTDVNSRTAMLPASDPLPGLPIMATTRLQLELLLNDSVIDLKALTDVILSDAGATLQILRLIGEEFPDIDERPKRIEDCIVSLSLSHYHQMLCASVAPNAGPHVAEWQHCRRLAECTREVARSLEGFSPEEAYLVGLLCRLGTFPHLLGWKSDVSLPDETNAVAVMLACHWNLPHCVLSAMREQQETEVPSRWRNILSLAHEMAQNQAA